MSIASAITAAQGKVANAYTAVSNKGGTLPVTQDLSNLPTAINSIPSGITPSGTLNISSNGTYDVTNYASAAVAVSGGYSEIPSYVIENGVAKRRTVALSSTAFSSITSIDNYGMTNVFLRCSGVTGTVDMSNVTSIGEYGMEGAFNSSGITSIDLSSLTTAGTSAFSSCFQGCGSFTSANFSSLTSITTASVFRNAFRNTVMETLEFPALTTITGNEVFYGTFGGASLKTLRFPVLTSLTGSSTFNGAFEFANYIENIYFNALTTTSFGTRINQLSGIFNYTRNYNTHTIHFPSNLESTIQGLSGYPNFGGTSGYVILAFDLAATS